MVMAALLLLLAANPEGPAAASPSAPSADAPPASPQPDPVAPAPTATDGPAPPTDARPADVQPAAAASGPAPLQPAPARQPSAAAVLPPASVEECTRLQRPGASAVRLQCDDAVATLQPVRPTAADAEAVAAFHAGLLRTFPHAVAPEPADIRVGVRTRRGWRVVVKTLPRDPVPTAEVDVLLTHTDVTQRQLLTCTRKGRHKGGARRCQALLEALWTEAHGGAVVDLAPAPPLDAGVAAAPVGRAPDAARAAPKGTTDVAGVGVETGGCTVTPGRLQCPTGELRWRVLSPDDAHLDVREGMARAALERVGAVVRARCAAESPLGPVDCRGLVVSLRDGRRVDMVVAMARPDGGSPVLLECTSPTPLTQGVPHPCSALLLVRVFEGP